MWDAAELKLLKEVPVGIGAYNVEPSADGKLVIVTNKKDQSVSLVDAASLTELVSSYGVGSSSVVVNAIR